jgi:hypothetical protein
MDQRRWEGREITSSACPPSDLDPPPWSGHPGARPSAFCSVSARGPIGVPTPATAAPQVRHRRLIPPLPVGRHLDHDDAVLVITGDAPAAALTFGGHGPAPFRGRTQARATKLILVNGSRRLISSVFRLKSRRSRLPHQPQRGEQDSVCRKKQAGLVRRRCGLVGSACSCSLSCSPESSG